MCVSLSVSYFKFGWATYVYYHKNDMFAQSSVRGSVLGLNVIPVSALVMGKKLSRNGQKREKMVPWCTESRVVIVQQGGGRRHEPCKAVLGWTITRGRRAHCILPQLSIVWAQWLEEGNGADCLCWTSRVLGKGGDDSSECICVIIDSRMLRTGKPLRSAANFTLNESSYRVHIESIDGAGGRRIR